MHQTRSLSLTAALGVALASGAAQAELETVATLPAETPPGNVAIGPDGPIFLSVHAFYGQPLKVVELLADGSTQPYPTPEGAMVPEGDGPGLHGVLGLQVDRTRVSWLLDGPGADHAVRLIG